MQLCAEVTELRQRIAVFITARIKNPKSLDAADLPLLGAVMRCLSGKSLPAPTFESAALPPKTTPLDSLSKLPAFLQQGADAELTDEKANCECA